ncbi:MAG TPA: hypothetical protein VIV65_01405 [Gemmatimonadaceae bacterium]|jgi:hypothetical protein
MSGALDELFAAVEEEFGVDLGGPDAGLFLTPRQVIDYVVEQTTPGDGMDADEHRDHVAAVVGELIAQFFGVTRYAEDSRFQDLGGR